MSRTSGGKRDFGHRHQIAARQAAARRAAVRRRMLLAGGAIIAVVAVVLALVLVKVTSGSKPAAAPPADGPTGAALAGVVKDVTTVPASVLDTVRAGSLTGEGIGSVSTSGNGYLAPVSGSALVSGGKPEVLYVGAEFCPFCAAARWPLIVALSRFGTFSGLRTTRSGVTNGAGQQEIYPATPTWTFYGSRYTSPYLTFTPVELQTNIPDPGTGGYTTLQTLTAAQQKTVAAYDQAGSVPFLDIGNAYVQMGTLTPYGPADLQNLTWAQIASALHDPSTALAQSIDGSANYLTAAFCKLTGNQPASACTATVRALQSQLG
jgi:Domain of unknown function (DUF929)